MNKVKNKQFNAEVILRDRYKDALVHHAVTGESAGTNFGPPGPALGPPAGGWMRYGARHVGHVISVANNFWARAGRVQKQNGWQPEAFLGPGYTRHHGYTWDPDILWSRV
jgi:hypothetical protein